MENNQYINIDASQNLEDLVKRSKIRLHHSRNLPEAERDIFESLRNADKHKQDEEKSNSSNGYQTSNYMKSISNNYHNHEKQTKNDNIKEEKTNIHESKEETATEGKDQKVNLSSSILSCPKAIFFSMVSSIRKIF